MLQPTWIDIDKSDPVGSIISKSLDLAPVDSYVPSLVAPFETRPDSADLGWRGEFWGKWALGVIDSIPFSPTDKNLELLHESVQRICQTQEANGYIGTYSETTRSSGFDIWNIKYTLWALASYTQKFNNVDSRAAVVQIIDYLCSLLPNLGPDGFLGKSIEQLQGAGIASMLDPLHLVYSELGVEQAEEIAKQILGELSGELPTSAGLGGFLQAGWDHKSPKSWPGAKAYELMATIEGVLKWGVTYSDTNLVERMIHRVRMIHESEILITGSGSSFELFTDGVLRESADILRPQETCVTVYWMRLCETAWTITSDPFFLDQLSQSLHNALLASVDEDASWWSYFCPLKGGSEASHLQFPEIRTSCCVSNGPRGLFSLARWAVLMDNSKLRVNCIIPGSFSFTDSQGTKNARISTGSSQEEFKTELRVEVTGIAATTLLLPRWSAESSNADTRSAEFTGSFDVQLTSAPKLVKNSFRSDVVSIACGPYVYALDGKSIPAAPKYLWMLDKQITSSATDEGQLVLAIEFENRPSHYFNFSTHVLNLRPYFALARQSRVVSIESRYLVWIPQPLVVGSFDAFGEIQTEGSAVANLAKA